MAWSFEQTGPWQQIGKVVIKITHVITGLAPDGAERMLQRIVAHMDGSRFANEIVTLSNIGLDSLGREIAEGGTPVATADMKKNPKVLLALHRLRGLLVRSKPDVVQTWMYHADLLGGLAAKTALGVPVVWGIHHASLSRKSTKLATIMTAKTCALLSRSVPAKVVCCSEASRRVHVSLGYQAEKMEVIPNGFDCAKFKPDEAARKALRERLGIEPSTFLIGVAARFHPDKDYETLIAAASLLSRECPRVQFAFCGSGVDKSNEALSNALLRAELQDKVHLLGVQKNVEQFLAGMDLVTSSSRAEAFPLSIGEAMSVGVPCVVTDVGDSAYLVGNSGMVVARENPAALAMGWKRMLANSPEQRRILGREARRRIQEYFSLSAITQKYENLYTRLVAPLCATETRNENDTPVWGPQ